MTTRLMSVTQLPETIKKLLLSHQNPSLVEIYECTNSEDFLNMSERFPLETTSLANRAGTTIVGYYMVGIALPLKDDTFSKPIVVYYYLNDSDWRIFSSEIKNEAQHRKKIYMEHKSQLKNMRDIS